jgi:hypothetical protein
MRAMTYQSTTKFLPVSRWFLGSLEFITDKFGDLTLQEPESRGIIGSDTGRLPPAPVRVGLVNVAQLRHRLSELGKTDSDHTWDKADHTLAVSVATTDPTHQPSLESNSESDGEVYIVGNREELPNKSVKEIYWETDEELAHAAHLAREAKRGKSHNGLQDD